MNHNAVIHHNPAPQALLSAPLRIVTAVVIALVTAVAVMTAQHESNDAVRSAASVLASDTAYVTLPSVEVVGRR